MTPVEHVDILVLPGQKVPDYGDLVAGEKTTYVVNEDPYAKNDAHAAMAFEIDSEGKLVLEDGIAKSVFLSFLVTIID